MGKKIAIAAAAVLTALLAVLVWRLDIPHWQRLDVSRLYAAKQTTMVVDAAGEPLSAGISREWTALDDIPESVRRAFLAAEDQRFYSHHGVSLRRIFAAMLSNLKSRSYGQGASTITQQLVKLTHLSGAKTLSRKAQEAFLALQLERRLSKDEILECYLNNVYFGKGAYGVGAAAKVYFDKTPAELSLSEAALLAGIIKAPSNYAPHVNLEKSVQRRDYVLRSMADCGYITDSQADRAARETVQLAANIDDGSSGWFMDAALEEAAEALSLTMDELLSGGYRIETQYDSEFQRAADALFDDPDRFPDSAADGTPVQAALVAMEPTSGAVRALVGGRSYDVRLGLNRATGIRRSPGSAIKPVSTYAAAIDRYGLSPTSMVEDTPRDFGNGYSPGNAGGSTYGTVTLREALSRSLNVATVDLADLVGVSAVRGYAERFGLTLSPRDASLSLALGSMTDGVSPAELCAAYAALANGGTRVKAHLVSRIVDAEGAAVYEFKALDSRAVRDSTAYMLTDMLETAASQGSARAMASAGIPVAAKTGTVSDSDGSTRDVWTAAYTPDLALTVWMGFDAPDGEHEMSSSEGGSGCPARLCAAFLNAVSDQLSGRDFAQPPSVRTVLIDTLALQAHDVRLAVSRTPEEYVAAEPFLRENVPTEASHEWDAPEMVDDLQLISRSGETPVLQFTARSAAADYLVLRTMDGETALAGTLTGEAGQTLRFADADADTTRRIQYAILPRHRLLYERGELLTGKESAAVTYSPGGILDWFQRGDPEPSPAPTALEIQSIFN